MSTFQIRVCISLMFFLMNARSLVAQTSSSTVTTVYYQNGTPLGSGVVSPREGSTIWVNQTQDAATASIDAIVTGASLAAQITTTMSFESTITFQGDVFNVFTGAGVITASTTTSSSTSSSSTSSSSTSSSSTSSSSTTSTSPSVAAPNSPTSLSPSSSTLLSTTLPPSLSAPASSTEVSSSSASPSNSTTPASPAPIVNHDKTSTGMIAGIAVLAVLFALAFLALLFVLFRNRRGGSSKQRYAPEPQSSAYSEKAPHNNVTITQMDSRLAAANSQVVQLQGELLSAGHRKPTKDDNTLVREWNSIAAEIKAWANEFFKNTSDNIDLTSDLHQLLVNEVPDYANLLLNGKSKILVVRSIVASVLTQSLGSGEFFGDAVLTNLGPLIQRGSDPAAYNNWRSETCMLLDKSPDFQAQRTIAIENITNKIEALCYPLASVSQRKSYQADPARHRFLSERIVQRMSVFAIDLGKQRANFQVVNKPPGTPFTFQDMDDVLQQFDTVQIEGGRWANEADGRPIKATVYPLLIKYGNESSVGYDRATVVAKAKVLL